MNTTISTIIPFYNCKEKLPVMLDSILAGKFMPCEIILVDDGSDDGSLSVANAYAEKYSLIKVYSQKHQGVSAARNLGLSHCSGYWISFLDADDYIEADMYDRMIETISSSCNDSTCSEPAVDGCICGYYTHKDGIATPYFRNKTAIMSSADILSAMFTDDNIRGFLFSRLFRHDSIKGMSFNQEIKVCEDLLFQTQLFTAHELTFAYVPAPLYHYIQNSDSLTGTLNFFENETFIYKPSFDLIKGCADEAYVRDSFDSILEHCMYRLLLQCGRHRDTKLLTQIRLLKKEMKQTKTPLAQKSKRRMAYELLPVNMLALFFKQHQ